MSEEEKKQKLLSMWTKEGLANGWVNEHLKYNQVKEELEELQERIDNAIEYIKNIRILEDEEIDEGIYYDMQQIKNDFLEILGDKEIEEIPLFKGTLEELDNLTLGDKENE